MIKNIFVYKGKGYYKDCEHVFNCIADDRKVDINTTGDIVCRIKRWIDFFSKNKGEYFQKWDKIFKFHLIADGINPHIENGQHYVKLNYQLLDDGKLLTHNQALFLLLGLNAYELGKRIKEKDLVSLNCAEEPTAAPVESLLWNTAQNQALLTSSYFRGNGKITSENLKKLANSYNFFTNQYESPKNDNLATKKRQSTIDQQNHINEIAKNIMLKYKNSTKTSLSEDVAEALENSLKPATIFKDYLKKYPNF